MSSKFTRVTYLCRDVSNYKFWDTFVLEGDFDIEDVRRWMFDGEFFIPERVGLPRLLPELRNDDDHDLRSLEWVERCLDGRALRSAAEFGERMAAASKKGSFTDVDSWFFGASTHLLLRE